MRRCPLCGATDRFKPGGAVDRCYGCNRALGPFGIVPLGTDDSPWSWPAFIVLVAFFTLMLLGR